MKGLVDFINEQMNKSKYNVICSQSRNRISDDNILLYVDGEDYDSIEKMFDFLENGDYSDGAIYFTSYQSGRESNIIAHTDNEYVYDDKYGIIRMVDDDRDSFDVNSLIDFMIDTDEYEGIIILKRQK